jgi:signal transduction histidine kinase
MGRGLSLANKCLLLFGGAVVLIVLAALFVPWFRMIALIDAGQLEVSRQRVATWERFETEEKGDGSSLAPGRGPQERGGVRAERIKIEEARIQGGKNGFLKRAIESLEQNPDQTEFQEAGFNGTKREYRYASATRRGAPGEERLDSLVILDHQPIEATKLIVLNAAFLFSAGSVVLTLSLATFYFITHKVVLAPVRALKETAERVRQGNLAIRSDIRTGDEFEELSETFNSMLTDMQGQQDQLRGINAALDMQLGELARTNSALFESAKLKGDFLANVSHELRTPLNSIIGFAELLLEIARNDAATNDPSPVIQKRIRYGENIATAGRNLLAMINALLEMAKIEAGKVELKVEPMNLRDACEALIGLIYPLANKKGITPKLEVPDDVPVIRTDQKKFQQIIFNFLSNAVKFTDTAEKSGRPPQITLRVERLVGARPGGEAGAADERIRISVIDNGPGIPEEEQGRVFEKFHQVESGHTREHSGTGLGLAISRELAALLRGELQLVSEVGRGSMFSLIVPLSIDPLAKAESELESRFRGALTQGKTLRV